MGRSGRERNGVGLRTIETLVISPSQDIDAIATRYANRLPRMVRFFMRGIGATRKTGADEPRARGLRKLRDRSNCALQRADFFARKLL